MYIPTHSKYIKVIPLAHGRDPIRLYQCTNSNQVESREFYNPRILLFLGLQLAGRRQFAKMASGALFGSSAGARSQSKNLVEFRAGKMYMKGKMVHPDKRKGTIYVYQSDGDSLMHFCWKERSKSTADDVSVDLLSPSNDGAENTPAF